MAFIDDLKQGVCAVVKTVGEKSEQLVGISKLHLKKTNLTNELKTTYIEIGKRVCEEKKAGTEFSDVIDQLCEKVELGLEAIKEVEAQIEAAKSAESDEEVVTEDIVEDEAVVEEVEAVEIIEDCVDCEDDGDTEKTE